MFGKRTYCILGTMLLAFASLGAGVSAEQNNEQVTDLEDLGILELSLSEDGVVNVVLTKEAFYSLMGADMNMTSADLPSIEEVAMFVGLGDDGNLVIENLEFDLADSQPDEISISVHLSEQLLDIIHAQDVTLEELIDELGVAGTESEGDYEDDYLGSRIYWADMAYQLRGSQDDYDSVMDAEDPEEEFYRLAEDLVETIDVRIQWADLAYQLRGCQDDYDRVMHADSPEEEFYAIYDEMIQDWEETDELEEESNESDEEDWDSEDSDEGTDEDVEDESGDELDEEHPEDPSDDNDREDRDRLDDALDMREDEITQIVVIVNTDGTIADVTVIVIYEDGEYDMFVFTMLLEDLRGRLANFDGIVVWNWVPSPPDVEERCRSGTLRGTFTVDEDGNGTLRGQIYNDAGELVTNMWGGFNTDGFVRGLAGDNVSTPIAQWKVVAEDGRFNGLWKMTNVTDDSHGILKGIYELNDDGTGGVFHGKWKAVGCHDDLGAGNDPNWVTPDRDDVQPRHIPLHVDVERVDDVRQLDNSPKEKPLMDKLGDVMDKPIVEDEDGGAIVDVGDAAVGSTLGTIALLGAGFIRRRITGGI